MKIKLLHIAALAVLMCGIISSCGKDDTKVIPRKKMAQIYAEMLMTDQWITSTPGVRMVADTSLVYEPILEKYGYDSDDYRKSIETYMDDPERFARILRTTGEILQGRITELEHQQMLLDLKANLPKLIYNVSWDDFFPYMFDEPYIHNYDSIAFEPDSVMWIYRLNSIERSDTIYEGLRMVILDSLMVNDSLACPDSLAALDSITQADSVFAFDSILKGKSDIQKLKVKMVDEMPKVLRNTVHSGRNK
jgi:hypothetical protein